jgi:hypothetical protein
LGLRAAIKRGSSPGSRLLSDADAATAERAMPNGNAKPLPSFAKSAPNVRHCRMGAER